MRSSVIEGNVDTSELQSMLAQARAEEDRLNSQILTLQSRNADLLRQISEASIEDAAALREEYNSNRDRIEALQSELRQVQSKIRDIEEALAESGSDDDVPTDDYHRIPAIMAELQSARTPGHGAATLSGGRPRCRDSGERSRSPQSSS